MMLKDLLIDNSELDRLNGGLRRENKVLKVLLTISLLFIMYILMV